MVAEKDLQEKFNIDGQRECTINLVKEEAIEKLVASIKPEAEIAADKLRSPGDINYRATYGAS